MSISAGRDNLIIVVFIRQPHVRILVAALVTLLHLAEQGGVTALHQHPDQPVAVLGAQADPEQLSAAGTVETY